MTNLTSKHAGRRVNPEVSKYMREMQRRSAEARWSGLSAEEKRAKMSALAKARWAKRKPQRRKTHANREAE
jgi:hypothetical protein